MTLLLRLLALGVLSYCNDTNGTDNVTTTLSYNPSGSVSMMEMSITTTALIPLSCHVCSVDYSCEAPKVCKITDKFCVIVIQVDGQLTSVFKYCSESCPIKKKPRGRDYRSYYTGCCVTDLCNLGRLGEGYRLGASIPTIAMAFVACFTGFFQIGL